MILWAYLYWVRDYSEHDCYYTELVRTGCHQCLLLFQQLQLHCYIKNWHKIGGYIYVMGETVTRLTHWSFLNAALQCNQTSLEEEEEDFA